MTHPAKHSGGWRGRLAGPPGIPAPPAAGHSIVLTFINCAFIVTYHSAQLICILRHQNSGYHQTYRTLGVNLTYESEYRTISMVRAPAPQPAGGAAAVLPALRWRRRDRLPPLAERSGP